MESALEEIEFLVRSSNRVAVLSRLADGRHTRNELAAETGASQATLGRILEDFEERSWIVRDDGEYVATATGKLVAEGVTDLASIVETERKLRSFVRYLPTHAMDFDLALLADATITTPSATRPDAPIQRLIDLVEGADEVRAFSHAFNNQNLGVTEEQVTAGDLDFKGVFSRSAIEALADDSALRPLLRSLLEADGASIRVRHEGVPLAATIVDETVHLLLRDENGVLQASIDSDEADVRSWARDTFDHYWGTATPLDADALSN